MSHSVKKAVDAAAAAIHKKVRPRGAAMFNLVVHSRMHDWPSSETKSVARTDGQETKNYSPANDGSETSSSSTPGYVRITVVVGKRNKNLIVLLGNRFCARSCSSREATTHMVAYQTTRQKTNFSPRAGIAIALQGGW